MHPLVSRAQSILAQRLPHARALQAVQVAKQLQAGHSIAADALSFNTGGKGHWPEGDDAVESACGSAVELLSPAYASVRDRDEDSSAAESGSLNGECGEHKDNSASGPGAARVASLQRRTGPAGQKAAALLHALAHVEQNAVRLFADTVVRFNPETASLCSPLQAGAKEKEGSFGVVAHNSTCFPDSFYQDLLSVAGDEGRHFSMLCSRMQDRYGIHYGDLPVVTSLWQRSGFATRHDVLERIAAMSLVEEARALDVHSRLRQRVQADGDRESAAVVDEICTEERTHVACGARWFHHVCAARNLNPRLAFRQTVRNLGLSVVPPHDVATRKEAGIPEDWYSDL